jgi:hypothetical protein
MTGNRRHLSVVPPLVGERELEVVPEFVSEELPEVSVLVHDYDGYYRNIVKRIYKHVIPGYTGDEPMNEPIIFTPKTTETPDSDGLVLAGEKVTVPIDYDHFDEFIDPLGLDDEPEASTLARYYTATTLIRGITRSIDVIRPLTRAQRDKMILEISPGREQRISPGKAQNVHNWRIAGGLAIHLVTPEGSPDREYLTDHVAIYRRKLLLERFTAEEHKVALADGISLALQRYIAPPVDDGPLTSQEIGLVNPMITEELVDASPAFLKLVNLSQPL